MKRIIITIVCLFAGMLGMAYLYFSTMKSDHEVNDYPLNIVSAHASIVFSYGNDKSFYEILEKQQLFGHLLGKEKQALFQELRKEMSKTEIASIVMKGQKVYLGMIPGDKNNVDFLISTSLTNDKKAPFFPDSKLKPVPSKANISIYEYRLDTGSVFISLKDQTLLLSNTATQLEKAWSNELSKKSTFSSYIKNQLRFNKNSLASLFINFEELPSFLKAIINSTLTGELSIFHQQKAFASLSYNFSKDHLLFTGSTEIKNENYLQLFNQLPGEKLVIDQVFPQRTANYQVYAINQYSSWQAGLKKLLDKRKETEKIKNQQAQIKQHYGLDLDQVFPPYFKGQFAVFQLKSGEKLGAIRLSNGEKVGQLLLEISSSYAPEIQLMRSSAIFYHYFGDPFKKFDKPYYTIIDNFLVMANHASTIQVFLNDYRNNQLLSTENEYRQIADQLSPATVTYYVGNHQSKTLFSRHLRPAYYRQYLSRNGFYDFPAFTYQMTGDKGKFVTNLLLVKKQAASTVAAE